MSGFVSALWLGRPIAVPVHAARLFNLDPTAQRHAIRTARLTQLREEYQRDPFPSNRQCGWVWVEDGNDPTVPVGEST